MSYGKILRNGLLKENPVLVMLLGACPALATTTLASTAIGMGVATTFVLICSNIVISLIKGIIPKQVRLPSFIIVIAGFVTMTSFLLQTYLPALYSQLGIFLSLIVVNCIILGRAEIFASKNKVAASAVDGIGMGLGFTMALFVMGSLREILGFASFFGMPLPLLPQGMMFFTTPAGGFFVYGMLIAVVNVMLTRMNRTPKAEIGCGDCERCGNHSPAAALASEGGSPS